MVFQLVLSRRWWVLALTSRLQYLMTIPGRLYCWFPPHEGYVSIIYFEDLYHVLTRDTYSI